MFMHTKWCTFGKLTMNANMQRHAELSPKIKEHNNKMQYAGKSKGIPTQYYCVCAIILSVSTVN